MTDGILLAETPARPDLEPYDTIIIDEAHERSLNIDFLLGYLKQLLPRRPDLKLIITSATIDPQRFSQHFNDCPMIEVSGRTYPVEVRYRPLESRGPEAEDLLTGARRSSRPSTSCGASGPRRHPGLPRRRARDPRDRRGASEAPPAGRGDPAAVRAA